MFAQQKMKMNPEVPTLHFLCRRSIAIQLFHCNIKTQSLKEAEVFGSKWVEPFRTPRKVMFERFRLRRPENFHFQDNPDREKESLGRHEGGRKIFPKFFCFLLFEVKRILNKV